MTGALVAIALYILGRWLVRRRAEAYGEAWRKVAHLSLVLKLAAAPAYLSVTTRFYNGGDYNYYDSFGAFVADNLRHGRGPGIGALTGTGFVHLATGVVYTIIGHSRLGAFFAFSFLGFCGLLLLDAAFRVGYPDGQLLRYSRLTLLLPSIVFWTSTIGKDPLMLLALGGAAYGAALLYTGGGGGFRWLLAGTALAAVVRPHIALAITIAVLIGYFVGKRGPATKQRSPFRRAVGTVVLVVGATVLLGRTATFFKVDSLNADSVSSIMQRTQSNTSGLSTGFKDGYGNPSGDSSSNNVLSPVHLPAAIVDVLFRPFPTEAPTLLTFLSSLESLVFLLFTLFNLRAIGAALRDVRRRPIVVLAITYAILFVFTFTSIRNYGILSRERIQVLPFFMVLLAARPRSAEPERPTAARRPMWRRTP